jgi:dTMP kinase
MPDGTSLDGRTMALLFAADRIDHLQREIEPLLAAGTTVVSDRYLMSSLAYQSEEAERDWVVGLARNILRPDLTILLDVSVEVAAQRRLSANRVIERYDEDEYLGKVASNYRAIAIDVPSVAILDGNASIDAVTTAISRVIAPLFAATTRP